MSRNRVYGGGLRIETVTASKTTWWTTDQYDVNAPLGTPVTITISPEIQDGDQVLIQDVAGNAGIQPITIVAPDGKLFSNGSASMQLSTPNAGVVLVYSINTGVIGVSSVPRVPVVPVAPAYTTYGYGTPGFYQDWWFVVGSKSQYPSGALVAYSSADTVALAIADSLAHAAIGMSCDPTQSGPIPPNGIQIWNNPISQESTSLFYPVTQLDLQSGFTPVLSNPFTGLTPGATYYLSPTVPGGITATRPTTPGQIVQVIGYAKDATCLVVNIQPAVLIPD